MADALGAFARSRAYNDEEHRPRVRGLSLDTVLSGPSLLRIECFEMVAGTSNHPPFVERILLFLVLFATGVKRIRF